MCSVLNAAELGIDLLRGEPGAPCTVSGDGKGSVEEVSRAGRIWWPSPHMQVKVQPEEGASRSGCQDDY